MCGRGGRCAGNRSRALPVLSNRVLRVQKQPFDSRFRWRKSAWDPFRLSQIDPLLEPDPAARGRAGPEIRKTRLSSRPAVQADDEEEESKGDDEPTTEDVNVGFRMEVKAMEGENCRR